MQLWLAGGRAALAGPASQRAARGRNLSPMQPHVSLITLAVDDLDRALAFYRDGLRWPTEGVMGAEFAIGAVAFFELAGGLKLALWPRTSLAADTGLPVQPTSTTGVCLAHNVGSPAEVESVLAQAQRAGARIVKPAQRAFWGGWAGYFQDLDGHLWEVAFNPDLPSAA